MTGGRSDEIISQLCSEFQLPRVAETLAKRILDDLKASSGTSSGRYTLQDKHYAGAAVYAISKIADGQDITTTEIASALPESDENLNTTRSKVSQAHTDLKSGSRIGRMYVAFISKKLGLSDDTRDCAEQLIEKFMPGASDPMVIAATCVYVCGIDESVTQSDVASAGNVSTAAVRNTLRSNQDALETAYSSL